MPGSRLCKYRIAGIFLSRGKNIANWWKNGMSHRKPFSGLLARTSYCPQSLQMIAEKLFSDRHTTAKFAKVFYL